MRTDKNTKENHMAEIAMYDELKIKLVPIEDVLPNTWNPKAENHAKVVDIEKSIKKHGFKQPIQVRTHPTEEGKYEIIDGEQRWTAMKRLKATHLPVYDNGEVSDADAQNETLWWQVQVPFETLDLASLVVDLHNQGMELPYSEAEIVEFKNMFEPESPEDEETENEDSPDLKSLNIKLTHEQFAVVQEALESIKSENECGDGRAMELMAADYLAGA
jgi:hypothetical protein